MQGMYYGRMWKIIFIFQMLLIVIISFISRVPRRHAMYCIYLVYLKSMLDSYNLYWEVDAGTLLGAVRQNSFAGRPTDIDLTMLGYSDDDLIKIFKVNGFMLRKKLEHRLQFYGCWNPLMKEHILVDVRTKCVETDSSDMVIRGYSSIYNIKVPITHNYIDRLYTLYGKEWMIPDKNQLSYKQPYNSLITGC